MLVTIRARMDWNSVFYAKLVGPQLAVLPITTCFTISRDDRVQNLTEHEEKQGSPEPTTRTRLQHMLVPGSILPGEYQLTTRLHYQHFSFGKHSEPIDRNA